MRSAELVGCRVFDSEGRDIGRVHDIRIQAGATPQDGSGEPAYEICALTVGSVAIAQRFGYGRGQMAGPWPLTLFFRALAKRSVMVGWQDVARVAPGRIDIRRPRRELETVLQGSEADDGRHHGGRST